MISTDRKIFEEGSAVRARMTEYGGLFDELHVVVFCVGWRKVSRVAPNTFAYPTNSLSRWFYVFDALRVGRRIVRQWRPSRITGALKVKAGVVTAQDPFETGLAGFLLAKWVGFGLELQVHTDFFDPQFAELSLLNRVRVNLAKFLLPRADSIRVVSAHIAENITHELAVPPERIEILPIYVDGRAIADFKARFDLKKKYPQFRFLILMAARLEREKNIPLALGIMARVVSKYPLTGLVVVGDGQEILELNDLAKQLKIDNNVIFEGWQEDLISYLKGANALLVTSRYEGYGLVFIEAAFAGCPVVTTNVGLAREFSDGVEALICGNGQGACLAGKIISLIESNELRERLKTNAYTFFANSLPNKRKYLNSFKRGIMKATPASQDLPKEGAPNKDYA